MDIEPNPANRRISYFYNPIVSKFVYAKDHPMKPERISMAHSLITTTGLYRQLNVYHSRQASKKEMTRFHNEEYVSYLEQFVSRDLMTKLNMAGIDRFAYPSDPSERYEFLTKRQEFKVG